MFGDNLRVMMIKRGISQKELASLINISESSISRYMNNERTPRAGALKKLSEALDCNIEFLLSGYTDEKLFEITQDAWNLAYIPVPAELYDIPLLCQSTAQENGERFVAYFNSDDDWYIIQDGKKVLLDKQSSMYVQFWKEASEEELSHDSFKFVEKKGDIPFSQIFANIIEEYNLTITELSSYLNIPSAFIKRYLEGTAKPSIKTLHNLADYLGCSIDKLQGKDFDINFIEHVNTK